LTGSTMLEMELLAGLNSGQQHPLDEMINNAVLLQQAQKAGVKAPEQEVESQLEAIKSQYDEKQFKQILEANNLSEDGLKKEISDQLVINNYIQTEIEEDQLSISEDEIRDSYDQVINQQPEGEKPNFEEVKPQIKGMLRQEKMQEAKTELLKGLREDMEIEVLL